MAKDFNGSVVLFNSATIGALDDIDYDDGGKTVAVGASDSTEEEYEDARSDRTITITVAGNTAIPKGSYGALAITWKDAGTQGTLASALVAGVKKKGSTDGKVTSTLTFKKKAS